MKRHGLIITVLTLALFGAGGCEGPRYQSETTDENDDRSLPIVRGAELGEYLQTADRPVLVEFGVDYNCSRCAQTKANVVQLSDDLRAEVDVIRVDFNSNARLVAQLGGTICPTYVLFDGSEHVLTRSFPYSIGLLEGDVLRRISDSND